jgi:hypothetical protein
VTPPENSERSGSNGATTGSATPPWQRVGRDTTDAVEDGSATEPSDGGWSTARQGSDVPVPGQAAESPAVTGNAARRLFGDTGDIDAATGDSGAKGRDTVNLGNVGSKVRPAPTALRRPGRGPRRARLQVKRFDPWSVLKLSLVLGVAMFFVWLVAVGVLYTVLDGMGVWDKLNGTYTSLVAGEGGSAPSDPLISAGRVFGIAAILGAINIVLISALATVSAFIYNVSADLAGGLEVTLSERE